MASALFWEGFSGCQYYLHRRRASRRVALALTTREPRTSPLQFGIFNEVN